MKKILEIQDPPSRHWVGDGFPVRTLFSYQSHGKQVSPFLLLDFAGPMEFPPADRPRGVGEHPHRGFETVTIVYEGEVAHQDSTGSGGTIGPGDVQWMTAAAGILHEEFHSGAFTRTGGRLHMLQLWVNLPAKDKMSEPRYQPLTNKDIPAISLPGGNGKLRIIAGEFQDRQGPAHTHTPMNVWDLRLEGGKAKLPLVEGWTTMLVVVKGTILVNGGGAAREAQLVQLDTSGSEIELEANNEAAVLVLNGEPIDEPIAGYGPFVMNTEEEIRQAIKDFNSGRFGRMAG